MRNWREYLLETDEKDIGDEDEYKAGHWISCAIGERAQLYPEVIKMELGFPCGIPCDGRLKDLGVRFSNAIITKDKEWALLLLDAMDDHILQLKREKVDDAG